MKNKEFETEEEKQTYIVLKSQEIVNCILEDLKRKVCLRRYDKLNMKVRELLRTKEIHNKQSEEVKGILK